MTASHLLQVNPKFIQTIEDAGMKFVGRSTDGERMEIMELEGRTTMGYIQHQILYMYCYLSDTTFCCKI